MIGNTASIRNLVLSILAGILALAASGPAMAEPEYMASSAAGLYEIDGESILRVERFQGQIIVRAGEEDRLRFLVTDVADRNIEIPVEMWKDGRILILCPEEDRLLVPIRMEAAVPPGFSLDIVLNDTEVHLANIYGDIVLQGDRLDAKILNVEGDISLELREGRARLQNISGDLDLDSRDVDVRIEKVGGRFDADLQGGRLEAGELGGPVGLDGEDAEVILTGNDGELRATLGGGSLTIAEVKLGGVLRLEGTPLDLKQCHGDIRVETDAAISFSDCKADLHFDAYGSSLTGTGNEGILEIKTNDAKIVLRKLNGAARIQGDRLEVDIQEVGGELWVLGVSSNIKIDNIKGPVNVVNEFGDVHILAASQMVDVENQDGNVTIERQTGPVDVLADGEQVTVSWSSMNWSENSVVENRSGDVALFLPKQGGCSVDARASYGRVETDVEGVVISDDGRRASGSVNRARRPVLRIRAEGDVRIMQARTVE